jgi:hypothetical protein
MLVGAFVSIVFCLFHSCIRINTNFNYAIITLNLCFKVIYDALARLVQRVKEILLSLFRNLFFTDILVQSVHVPI